VLQETRSTTRKKGEERRGDARADREDGAVDRDRHGALDAVEDLRAREHSDVSSSRRRTGERERGGTHVGVVLGRLERLLAVGRDREDAAGEVVELLVDLLVRELLVERRLRVHHLVREGDACERRE